MQKWHKKFWELSLRFSHSRKQITLIIYVSFCEKDPNLCQDVVRLLEATGTNITEEHMANHLYGTDDKHYFLDIDMAVLGAPAEEYNLYTKHVREEYSFLSNEFYKNLRLKVSSKF